MTVTHFFYCSFIGVSSTTNNVAGIDAMCPSSKDDFTEFEKLLKEKICQFEKSVHYANFLESLVRELCISCKQDPPPLHFNRTLGLTTTITCIHIYILQSPHVFVFFFPPVEVDDLKKVSSSVSVLLSEKQKQEKVSAVLFSFVFTLSKGGCCLPRPAKKSILNYSNVYYFNLIVYLINIWNGLYLNSQQNKGKKKKKGVTPGGGFKAQMKGDFDLTELDGGYAQDFDDFMWQWLHRSCPLPMSALRNAAVPSHAVQCHPGKSELFVAPFIFASVTRGTLPGSIRFHHLLCPFIWNCLFFCFV